MGRPYSFAPGPRLAIVGSSLGGTRMSLWETMNFTPRGEKRDLASMAEEIDHLSMLVKALATLCHQHGVFTEKQFEEMRDFIDLQDGVLDGKAKSEFKPRVCPKCKKKVSPSAKKCMWCEAALA